MKLNFTNGKGIKPSVDAKEFEQWQRAHCLVTSWILNSISKEIVEAFSYTTSAENCDSGATNHVCADRHAFHTLQSLYCPSSINLPDASKRLVIKDWRSKKVLAIGRQVRRLYILDRDSFSPDFITQYVANNVTDDSIHSVIVDASLSVSQEPTCYAQAKGHMEWEIAMKEELNTLEKNDTWSLSELLEGKKSIGYNQIEGVDHIDSFPSVAKAVTVRLLLAVATSLGWPVHQLDINNAFLHGYLNEDIYMTPPDGYVVPAGKSKHDYCLFTMGSGSSFLDFLVYVDDALLVGPSDALIAATKAHLDRLFTIKDLGCAKYFLWVEIACSNHGMLLTQQKYITDLVRDTGLEHAKNTTTPLPAGIRLQSEGGATLSNPELYQWLVGRLLYLNFPRPDISYAMQQLSQFLQHPCQQHLDAALHLVKYLKTFLNGVLYFLGVLPRVLEYKEAKHCVSFHETWISYLLCDLHIPIHTPIPFFCDNKAVQIVENPIFHERTKHLEIDCHLVHDKFKARFLIPTFVSSTSQVADVFTKALPGPRFFFLVSKLSMDALHPHPACGGDDRITQHAHLTSEGG
ncbi:Retrovirus-related Pol polyprotein from transposon RE1 [Sesamum angolense]|uniref:Retrovirus-related Pol polyprotein from transposon RE1 n=1 Tax=Sesamum angolense TaxID=2727404 RepID=A0AAE2C2G8_9LAMI|nr:Retrovirus-related Pol polyprotein from transposon RE1 [Sesamum angolense]